MNTIQIFGSTKSNDSKKAERWFKERKIRYQFVDMRRDGMSGGEFDHILPAVGGVDKLIDWEKKDEVIDLMRYMNDTAAKEDRLYERQDLMRLPVVRCGKTATVGYAPEVWENWK